MKHSLLFEFCRDPGYLEYCPEPNATNPASLMSDPAHSCLRKNQCHQNFSSGRHEEEFVRPIKNSTLCDADDSQVTDCLPRYVVREEIRTVHMLGTSYHSYLQGSLEDVKSMHPESLPWEAEERRQEPEICPFASFEIYHKELDFAEVGYQTRITGEISYFGTGIPTEADLLVEFDRNIGIIVEVSSSLDEDRHFTTIRKTVDISFEMTDYVSSSLYLYCLLLKKWWLRAIKLLLYCVWRL